MIFARPLLLAALVSILAGVAHAFPHDSIACGETRLRVLGSDPDDLAISALPGEVLGITVVGAPAHPGFEPRWRLLDVEGESVLLSNGSHHCDGRCETTPLPGSGGFTLHVSDTGVGTGTYSVTVEAVSATADGLSNGPPAPTCERVVAGLPDGTRPIPIGTPVAGVIVPIGETDTFTFVASAGEVVQAELDTLLLAPGFVAVWEAFDATGARVPFADGAPHCAGSCETAPLATDGVVTILVADDGDDSIGAYNLTVGHHPATTTTLTTATTTSTTSSTDDHESTTTSTATSSSSTTSSGPASTTTTSTGPGTTTTTLAPELDLGGTITAPPPATPTPLGTVLATTGTGLLLVGAPHHAVGSGDSQVPDAGEVLEIDVTGAPGSSGFGTVAARLEKPGTPSPGDLFGAAVAAASDGVIVGAPGVEAVYRFPSTGDPTSIDSPLGADAHAAFGAAVAASGSFVAVGAPHATVAGLAAAGSVFVFGAGAPLVLQAPTPTAGAGFGSAIAAADGMLLVGAPGNGSFPGAAFLFDAATGALQASLAAPTPTPGDEFGAAVGFVDGDPIVGAPGIGMVFRFVDGKPHPLDPGLTPGSRFGAAIAVDGETIVVGAPGELVDGVANGAVYVFDATTGALLEILHDTPAVAGDAFGTAVAARGGRVFVGIPGDDTGTTDGGAVHAYAGTTLLASFRERLSTEAFGAAAVVEDGTLIVGAPDANGGHGLIVRVDPVTNQTTVVIQSPQNGSGFGASLAVVGSTVAVGAPQAATAAGDHVGIVYLVPDVGAAVPLANPNPLAGDEFGFALGTIGGDLLASAPFTGTDDTGVVYRMDLALGVLRVTYAKPTPVHGDFFGAAVAGDGTDVLIGTPLDGTSGTPEGGVYVFDGDSAELRRFIPNPEPATDLFGAAVALGQWIVVGAPLADGGAGVAYVIDRATGVVRHRLERPTPSPGDDFGASVALFGNRVLVGAPFVDDNAVDTGAVYLFDGDTGALVQTIRNPPQGAFDHFGSSIAAGDAGVLIGSPGTSRVYHFDPIQLGGGSLRALRFAPQASASVASVCGNGLVEPGELCDDGNRIDTDDCRNDCTPLCCTIPPAAEPSCDDGDRCTTDHFDPVLGCMHEPSGLPGCCKLDADCPGGECRVCVGCFIYKWDCCGSPSQCIPANPACDSKTCLDAAYCQCEGKLSCGTESIPAELTTPFAAACDQLRLQGSVGPDGTPATKADFLVARQRAKSVRRSLRNTIRLARSATMKAQLSRACRKQIVQQVKVVRHAVPRGKHLRRCILGPK
jgi:cysteine-rich repeat protein